MGVERRFLDCRRCLSTAANRPQLGNYGCGARIPLRRFTNQPAIACARMSAFVTTNSHWCIKIEYVVNPIEAAICPRNSHFDTPSQRFSRHCLCTCLASVASKISELNHPITQTITT